MNLYFNTTSSVFLQDPTLEGYVWAYSDTSHQTKLLLDPAVIPVSYSTSLEPTLSLDKIQLGDGYEQVTEQGIRPVRDVYNITFGKRRPQVAIAMDRFFRGEDEFSIYNRRPSEYFWFTPAYPFDKVTALPRKFRCETWKMIPETYSAITITAQFIESFEP